MNKVIISLEGVENAGKTYVLNQVISMMIKELKTTTIIRLKDYKDKTYIFEINEKSVLITTMGDDEKSLLDQLEFAHLAYYKPFDIIVYAKRYDKDFDCIKNLIANHGYHSINPIMQTQMNVVKKVYPFKGQKKKITILHDHCLQENNKNAYKIFKLIHDNL